MTTNYVSKVCVNQGYKYQDSKTGDTIEITTIETGGGSCDKISYDFLTGDHRPMDGWWMYRDDFDADVLDGILKEAI